MQTVSISHSDDGFPDILIERDLMVSMRDGVQLCTDVYRPVGGADGARFPVIIERTPYGKSVVSRAEVDYGSTVSMSRLDVAAYFVRAGYVVIYQDCRGRFGSEGEFTKYLSEGEDGADTIAWIRAQPWCDGKIGMMGLSYAAHTQLAPACLGPEGLAALVLDCGGFSSGYHSGMRQGGALELRQATWAYTQARESTAAMADPTVAQALAAENIGDWFGRLPWKPGHSPLKWVPEYEDYLFEQWTHGSFDDYWKKNGIYARDSYPVLAQIPQMHITGWYDTYVASSVENYLGVVQQGQTAARLIIGPWLHGDRSRSHAGDVDFGANAALDGTLSEHWRAMRLSWFDRHLKGLDGDAGDAPIRIFIMGGGPGGLDDAGRLRHGGEWLSSDSWPLAGSVETNLLLQPGGRLGTQPCPAPDALSYQFDPDHPVPTIGGSFSSGQPLFFPGAFDQRESERFFGSTQPGLPLAARSDVLVFETEPLAEDLVLAGPLRLELEIESDSPDTDFTGKLIDVYPPSPDYPRGYAMNITDGILRCRYRDSWESPELMQPRTRYRVSIELLPTANRFLKGHLIRLDVSSSNFPKFDVNPNSGEPEGSANLKRVATNTIHLGGERPSRLIVQILGSAT